METRILNDQDLMGPAGRYVYMIVVTMTIVYKLLQIKILPTLISILSFPVFIIINVTIHIAIQMK